MFSPQLTATLSSLLLLVSSQQLTHAASEVMALRDSSGTALTARLISCDGTSLTITRESDKKTFTLPLARLDEASQASVKSWMSEGGNLAEKFEITVDTGKTRKKTGAEDFDDKRINLEPFVTLKNPATSMSTRDGKVTVLILGRPVHDTSAIYVFKKASFDLPKLAPLGTQSFTVGNISSAYDDRGYAQFGARYLGYVVLVHDHNGKVLYDSISVPAPFIATYRLSLLKLAEKRVYDKDLASLPISIMGSGY